MSVFACMCGCYRFSAALPSLPSKSLNLFPLLRSFCCVVEGTDLRLMLNTVNGNDIPSAQSLTHICHCLESSTMLI